MQKSVITEGSLRVGPLIGVFQVLRELEVDPAEIMADVGLDLSLFDDPENSIPFATMGRLLKVCAAQTHCAHFGLLMGQRAGLSSLGLIGLLAQHSPDVGSALRNLVFHLHLHDRGAVPNLSVEQGIAVLGYAIYQPGVEGSDQIYDGAIAITCNIMRALCGAAWVPDEVLFSHRRPSDIKSFRCFFQSRLRFDMEQTALVFPATWLDRPVAGADPNLCQTLQQQIAALENLSNGDWVSLLRRVLRNLLITHQSSLEQVARLFSMHRRTLNRRLEAQGATFQGLVAEVRYEIARQLLENTRMSMVQIAATLDYGDAAAFTRAFRRWSGTTPTAWRAQINPRDWIEPGMSINATPDEVRSLPGV
ncbi:MAG: AraC family transcriptional regulator [Candidatus Competibacteraceae bacterium]|nr:AraC family transcriptional regulator [Candidatus Competibacteraceae bacterium]